MDNFIITDNSSTLVRVLPVFINGFAYLMYTAGLIFLFDSIINGSVLSPRECIKRAWVSLPPFFLTTFLSGLIITCGFFLLIVPGIILAGKLSFSQFYILLSEANPVEAIKKSFIKTKGFTTIIIGSLFLASIPLVIIYVLFIIFYGLLYPHIKFIPFSFWSLVIDFCLGFYFLIFLIILFRIFFLLNETDSDLNSSGEHARN
jgi:hypothetical protein